MSSGTQFHVQVATDGSPDARGSPRGSVPANPACSTSSARPSWAAGLVAGRYAHDRLLALSATLTFEHQDDEVEGDGASAAELKEEHTMTTDIMAIYAELVMPQ